MKVVGLSTTRTPLDSRHSAMPEASFVDSLNADSLDLVELIMAFEEEFTTPDGQLKISDEDAEAIRTVQDAVTFIKSKGVAD